jgi:hypothetical protein
MAPGSTARSRPTPSSGTFSSPLCRSAARSPSGNAVPPGVAVRRVEGGLERPSRDRVQRLAGRGVQAGLGARHAGNLDPLEEPDLPTTHPLDGSEVRIVCVMLDNA